jgi:hypothetical protein
VKGVGVVRDKEFKLDKHHTHCAHTNYDMFIVNGSEHFHFSSGTVTKVFFSYRKDWGRVGEKLGKRL